MVKKNKKKLVSSLEKLRNKFFPFKVNGIKIYLGGNYIGYIHEIIEEERLNGDIILICAVGTEEEITHHERISITEIV